MNSPFDVFDLSSYKVQRLPKDRSGFNRQWVLTDQSGLEKYTSYYDAARAVAEVTYSRLSHALGLPCVEAYYGHSVNVHSVGCDYVSVSEYSPSWPTLHEGFKLAQLYGEEINLESWKQHYGICLLINRIWQLKFAGYIDDNKNFVKANNGQYFFATALDQVIRGRRTATGEPPSVSEFLEKTRETLEARIILPKIAILTQEEIDDFVRTPEGWEQGSKASSYIRFRLLSAKENAKRIWEAIEDESESLLD